MELKTFAASRFSDSSITSSENRDGIFRAEEKHDTGLSAAFLANAGLFSAFRRNSNWRYMVATRATFKPVVNLVDKHGIIDVSRRPSKSI